MTRAKNITRTDRVNIAGKIICPPTHRLKPRTEVTVWIRPVDHGMADDKPSDCLEKIWISFIFSHPTNDEGEEFVLKQPLKTLGCVKGYTANLDLIMHLRPREPQRILEYILARDGTLTIKKSKKDNSAKISFRFGKFTSDSECDDNIFNYLKEE